VSNRGRGGFTIFEALVAMVIVGLVSVAALEAVGSELSLQYRAQRTIEAQALAVVKMQSIQMLTAEELQLLPDSIREGTFDEPMQKYKWTTTSTPIATEDYLNDVTLQIDWESGSYLVRTYLYRPTALANITGGSP
jgi:type II secretory pathway pseudopilin PulG